MSKFIDKGPLYMAYSLSNSDIMENNWWVVYDNNGGLRQYVLYSIFLENFPMIETKDTPTHPEGLKRAPGSNNAFYGTLFPLNISQSIT